MKAAGPIAAKLQHKHARNTSINSAASNYVMLLLHHLLNCRRPMMLQLPPQRRRCRCCFLPSWCMPASRSLPMRSAGPASLPICAILVCIPVCWRLRHMRLPSFHKKLQYLIYAAATLR